MKVFSADDFEKFPVDSVSGHINCPPGDYSRVKTVPSRCVFRNAVTFGKGVHIRRCCSFRHSVYIGRYSNTAPLTMLFNTALHGVVALAFNGKNGRLRDFLKQTKLSRKQIKYRARVVESVANRWPDATRL